jgi:hypothetical protein
MRPDEADAGAELVAGQMGSYRLVFDAAAVDEVLHGPSGPVMGHMIRVGDRLIELARVQLAPHEKTGRLAASIVKRFVQVGDGLQMAVIAGAGLTDPNYAYWMHEGNWQDGDPITPKKSKHLVFEVDGHLVFAKKVKAFRGTRYLTDNLPEALETR